VVCVLMDLPLEDAEYLRKYTDEFAVLVDPVSPTGRAAEAAAVLADGYRYLERRIRACQARPSDSLLSAIANAQFENGRLASMDECLSIAHVALIAGNETTRNAISSAMYTLVTRPDLWRQLKADRALIPEFVEEVLRTAAPANTTPRVALADVELGGVVVPKGACLFMMWGSGSLDEEVLRGVASGALRTADGGRAMAGGIQARGVCSGSEKCPL
jgi:cytochrome P450